MKILPKPGTEFKNKHLIPIADQLGVEHKVYVSPFNP